jgi:hypothetical protein
LKTVIFPNCKGLLIRQMVLQYVYTGEIMGVSERDSSDVQVTHQALEIIRENDGCCRKHCD